MFASKRSAFFASATALALLAAPLGQAQAATKVVITQAFQSVLYLPFYIAMDKGFFAKQGLEVDKETAGTPPAALSAVISGSADFSIHGPEWTAIAASKGAKVDIIAAIVGGAAVWIAATPDFDFKDVQSFKGQKIVTGMMPTTSTSLFLNLLKQKGMDGKTEVDQIPVPIGTEPGPFLAGQAKVAVMYEPGLDQVVAKGMKVVFGFPKAFGPYAFSSLTARADADPVKAQGVVNGLQEALTFIQANPAEAIKIAQQEFPKLEPSVVEAAVKRMIAEKVYPATVETTPDALITAMNTQIGLGNLKAQPVYADFVVQTYAKKAIGK
ncbi:ABC transporter substrate-binding protein [Beijerinckia sp. L45]|uniref:ABC transporter substrate-binding protein n=1 Tax=Beijerinckia sp. L45 TaxID=1641855 RepID=UPI001FEEC177|nr:ABC transporter substrate-binding protein [Beijerinckia sp. L45]